MTSRRLQAKLEDVIRYAENVELYGKFAELELRLCQYRFEDALRLVKQIRVRDNVPVAPNGRVTKDIRHKESMLFELEAQIAELKALHQLGRPERRQYPYDITTQHFGVETAF